MRKAIYFSLFVCALCMLAACSSSETPGEAAKKYVGYVIDGKYEEFIDGIDNNEELNKEQLEAYREVITASLKKTIEEKEGIKNIEIISEVTSPNGNEATVILNTVYGNGKVDDASYKMIKRGSKWKLILN